MNVQQNQFMLVIAEFPRLDQDSHKEIAAFEFLAKTRNIEGQAIADQRIGENIWRIPLDGGMPLISRLIQEAQAAGVPLYTLPLSQEQKLTKSAKQDAGMKT